MNAHEFMVSLTPENQEVFKEMMKKSLLPITGEGNLYGIVAQLTTIENLGILNQEEKEIIAMMMSRNRDRFAAKLTFDQRCQVLALHRLGVTREDLAMMFGINRRTVTHIYNPQSEHYKSVREKEK